MLIRRFAVASLLASLSLPAVAQTPAGWQMRVDRSTNAADPDDVPDVKVMTMGTGMHVITGPAVTLWNPANTATGAYTLKGTFNLMKPSGHRNYYGLVFGGGSLDGAQQNYLYFIVAQDGTFTVKHRAGDATHDVQARTPHAAIVQPDSTGKSINALEVRVAADKIDFVANGTVVHSAPRSGMASRTDGVWGVRVNHQLNVHIDGLGVSK